MGLLQRLFRQTEPRAALIPLYNRIVATARQPDWYAQGGVPDTLDGRFDMIAAVLSLVLFRLEALGGEAAASGALLTEVFVTDMDGQLRELGIGDLMVGKHIGKMMSALGGRLSAYRDVMQADDLLKAALIRNLYRGIAPTDSALTATVGQFRALANRVETLPHDALVQGAW